jgi:hypothetical protein
LLEFGRARESGAASRREGREGKGRVRKGREGKGRERKLWSI